MCSLFIKRIECRKLKTKTTVHANKSSYTIILDFKSQGWGGGNLIDAVLRESKSIFDLNSLTFICMLDQ